MLNSFLKFGKYSSLTYSEVIRMDLDYVKWCCSRLDCSPAMHGLRDYYAFHLKLAVQVWGYHLLLEGGNHYIGITSNWPARISSHMRGNGSSWTRLHPVVKVLGRWKIRDTKLWEKSKTLETMKKYGWKKVRGYCWCSRNMTSPPAQLRILDGVKNGLS